MDWTRMTIGKKIGAGFSVVLILLAVVGLLSFIGVGSIVKNASEVIEGNKLDGTLAQKEVDHLNWANRVNELLNDKDVTELDVQTDGHKCGFGKWLYGEGRKNSEKLIPTLVPLLKEIETPHARLHASAIEIEKHFKQADEHLSEFLVQKEVDHLKWRAKVDALFLENLPKLDITTDFHQCGFGKFLYGKAGKKAAASDPQLAELIKEVKAPHARLHESAVEIQKTYQQMHPGLIITLKNRFDDHRRLAAKVADALLVNKKPEVETDPLKCKFGKWLAGDEVKKTTASWPEFAAILEKVKQHHAKFHKSADTIQKIWKKVHPGLIVTLQNRLDDHRTWAADIANALLAGKRIKVEKDPKKCRFGRWLLGSECRELTAEWPEFADIIGKVEKVHANLHKSAKKIGFATFNDSKIEFYQKGTLPLLKKMSILFHQAAMLEQENVEIAEYAYSIYKTVTMKALAQVGENFTQIIALEEKKVKAFKNAQHIFKTKTIPALDKTAGFINKLVHRSDAMVDGMNQARSIFAHKTEPALLKTQELLNKIRKEARANVMTDVIMLNAAKGTKRNVTIAGTAAIVIGIFLAFFIAGGIISVMQKIGTQMDEGAGQVASASGQVSSSSQSLAEGSSQQAASIEETSSSMEEMASMTRQNATNAGEADNLMKEANTVVKSANSSMTELTASMEDISKASEDTSKIIKTIDEIAFQTNLLALNAAVEAARAGEAGAGFAVVADEVRNLAMRAADAAKDTARMIEQTVKKVGDGSEIVTRTSDEFDKVADSAKKVGELVGEISAASKEQSDGIEQVNKAVSEMDKVVQQNAANAEESASASEEMSAQAEQMKESVEELMKLVGGKDKKAGPASGSARQVVRRHKPSLAAPKEEKQAGRRKNEVKADQVIPFDDDDGFENF